MQTTRRALFHADGISRGISGGRHRGGIGRARPPGIDRGDQAGGIVGARLGEAIRSRIPVSGRGGHPCGVVGILIIELCRGADGSGRGAVQMVGHRLHGFHDLIGVRCELFGEHATHMVVTPAAFRQFQAVLQPGVGPAHPIRDLGQPRAAFA
ncbi:hypothetical protein [Nocardia sp. NPDC003345]